MHRSYFKTIEELSGVGRLIQNGNPAGTVYYRITVQQQMLVIAESLKGSHEEFAGLKSSHGTIAPIGRAFAPAGKFTLRLADGRELDILVTQSAGPGRPCRVSGTEAVS